MWPTLFSLLGLAVLVLLWIDASRVREYAQAIAARLCAEAGVQLLDQTVMLREIRPIRAAWGLALKRRYVYEYSSDGVHRERGQLTLIGMTLDSAIVPNPPPQA